jgi:hypothetical protein
MSPIARTRTAEKPNHACAIGEGSFQRDRSGAQPLLASKPFLSNRLKQLSRTDDGLDERNQPPDAIDLRPRTFHAPFDSTGRSEVER